jgi:predicted enzyme related to lactoylglutathione lyase
MSSRIAEIVIDCSDANRVAGFWSAVLGWAVQGDEEEGLWMSETGIDDDGSLALIFQVVPEPKLNKNRLHMDLSPQGCDQSEELERLLGLGATRADVGQTGDESWVVLADPDGNEFCLLRGRVS